MTAQIVFNGAGILGATAFMLHVVHVTFDDVTRLTLPPSSVLCDWTEVKSGVNSTHIFEWW